MATDHETMLNNYSSPDVKSLEKKSTGIQQKQLELIGALRLVGEA